MRMPIAGLLIAMLAAPAAAQFPPAKLKNVKVFPADIPVAALIDTMKGFTRALGVRCTYCHVGREDQSLDQYDFASDDKPAKLKARVMLRMVNAINTEHLSTLPSRRDPPIVVSCTTCHHGLAQPRTIQQVVLMAYAAGGIDSAINQYRALRTRYYGSAAYDFGEVPLTDVATSIAAQGKTKDALRLQLLNTELLPNSSFAFRQLGFSYLDSGDTASAVTAWQHRLEIDPENPEAKQLLSRIRKP
ncbi:MAG: c-type cytochrome [Gemmatimonadales bacterium]